MPLVWHGVHCTRCALHAVCMSMSMFHVHDSLCLCTCAGLLPIGSTVQLAPSHCDPTVNLHEWIVGVRGGVVETTWPIDARGP